MEKETMKTCYFCKGPIEESRIEYMAHRAGRYVLLKDLPAEVCTQCGEVYIDDNSSRNIDEALADNAFAGEHLNVPVVRCGGSVDE